MRTTETFAKVVEAWAKEPRYIDCAGGTRSGKTYAILQVLSLLCPRDEQPTITSVVSETMPHLSRGAIRDFKAIMAEDGRWEEDAWNKSQSIYTFKNGSILEFFSADQIGKVHGPARDRLFINEANNIDYDTARQLIVRTSGMVVWDYNPTRVFWAHENYAPRENCISIHSTYRDNCFLTAEQVAEIESYRSDKRWWRVYGEGLVGQIEGTIYNFEQVEEIPESASVEAYGMDFGFSSDPTAIVHLYIDKGRKAFYVDEVCYRTRMLNSDIIQVLKENGVPMRSVPIYADCAEPKSIAEIFNAGYNIKPCDKSGGVRNNKLKFQINFVQGWKMYVTKRSTDVIKELRNYVWQKDRDGRETDIPIDAFNHALDAMRYALFTHLAGNSGNYSIRTF